MWYTEPSNEDQDMPSLRKPQYGGPYSMVWVTFWMMFTVLAISLIGGLEGIKLLWRRLLISSKKGR